MYIQEVFHCDIYNADLSVNACKQRRDKTMLSKLRYILDPYERCGTCKQAYNVDANEIEVRQLVYDAEAACVVDSGKVSIFTLPIPKKKKPVKLLQSAKVRKLKGT